MDSLGSINSQNELWVKNKTVEGALLVALFKATMALVPRGLTRVAMVEQTDSDNVSA